MTDVSDFIRETCTQLTGRYIALMTLSAEYRAMTGRELKDHKKDDRKTDRIFWKG